LGYFSIPDLIELLYCLKENIKRMFFPKQIEAGNEVIEHFEKGCHHVLLYSQMQAGKTGTYNWIIKQAFNKKLIKRCFVISGSNETILYQQACADLLKFQDFWDYNRCHVYFRSTFRKIKSFDNSLVVIDESHLDQTKKQQMDLLFTRLGLSLDGSADKLRKQKIYIVSVSATPFSEFSDILHMKDSGEKQIVYLHPDTKYRGVQYFYEKGLIKPA
jgi:hypothetical protein